MPEREGEDRPARRLVAQHQPRRETHPVHQPDGQHLGPVDFAARGQVRHVLELQVRFVIAAEGAGDEVVAQRQAAQQAVAAVLGACDAEQRPQLGGRILARQPAPDQRQRARRRDDRRLLGVGQALALGHHQYIAGAEVRLRQLGGGHDGQRNALLLDELLDAVAVELRLDGHLGRVHQHGSDVLHRDLPFVSVNEAARRLDIRGTRTSPEEALRGAGCRPAVVVAQAAFLPGPAEVCLIDAPNTTVLTAGRKPARRYRGRLLDGREWRRWAFGGPGWNLRPASLTETAGLTPRRSRRGPSMG